MVYRYLVFKDGKCTPVIENITAAKMATKKAGLIAAGEWVSEIPPAPGKDLATLINEAHASRGILPPK